MTLQRVVRGGYGTDGDTQTGEEYHDKLCLYATLFFQPGKGENTKHEQKERRYTMSKYMYNTGFVPR